jgi:predicted kinase
MPIICPDSHLYNKQGVYEHSPERAQKAWALCYQELHEALADPRVTKLTLLVGIPGVGKSTWISKQPQTPSRVWFDATFVKPEWRAPIIKIAQAYGIPVEALWFKAPPSICKERNSRRSADRKIPEGTIKWMYEQVHRTPPTVHEGFSSVRVIKTHR